MLPVSHQAAAAQTTAIRRSTNCSGFLQAAGNTLEIEPDQNTSRVRLGTLDAAAAETAPGLA